MQTPGNKVRDSSDFEENMKQERYFSGLAANHGVNEASNVDKSEVIFDLLLPPTTHNHVLECGGGAGFYTARLLSAGYKVTCIDLSAEALEVNRQSACDIGRESELRTLQGDFTTQATNLEGNFDMAVFIKVLHHFPDLASIERALLAAFNKLRPGGVLMLFEPKWSKSDPETTLSCSKRSRRGQEQVALREKPDPDHGNQLARQPPECCAR